MISVYINHDIILIFFIMILIIYEKGDIMMKYQLRFKSLITEIGKES